MHLKGVCSGASNGTLHYELLNGEAKCTRRYENGDWLDPNFEMPICKYKPQNDACLVCTRAHKNEPKTQRGSEMLPKHVL